MEIRNVSPPKIVPGAPSIVPAHSNRLESFFGNADMPGEEDIMSVMSSLLSRFVTLPGPSLGAPVAADFWDILGGASEEVIWSMFLWGMAWCWMV